MDLDQMAYRCPKAEVAETVRLEGHRLTFAGAGSGLATIFPEEGSHVDGVLWSLTGDCEKSLDLYEGYPDFYDKQEITVKNKGGREIKAIVYNEKYQHGIPECVSVPRYDREQYQIRFP